MSVSACNSISSSVSPVTSSSQTTYSALFHQILRPYIQQLQRTSYTAVGTSNDFGVEVKRLLFPATPPGSKRMEYLHLNMKEVAATEGFELDVMNFYFYPRDHYIKLADGAMFMNCPKPIKTRNLTPDPNFLLAIQRMTSKSNYYKENGFANSENSFFAITMGGSVHSIRPAGAEYIRRYKNGRQINIPIEGGDIYALTNSHGKRKLFVGQELATLIHCYMRFDEGFKQRAKEGRTPYSEEEIEKAAEEMYSMGLLKNKNGTSGFISFEDRKNQNFKPPVFTYNQLNKDSAVSYLQQKEYVLELIARTFKLDFQDLHIMPQLAPHLDFFMTPGPNHTIFLQDYAVTHKLLLAMKENGHELKLTEKDLGLLEQYIAVAERLEKEVGPLLVKAKKEIENAGFTVLPTPGIFNDWSSFKEPQKDTHHVLFMNGISGWSTKNKRPYFVTLGAEVGDQLGVAMMRLFENFLKEYQPDIQVHFVGYDPQNPTDYSEAMIWINVRNKTPPRWAGVHCVTFEDTASDHDYKVSTLDAEPLAQ